MILLELSTCSTLHKGERVKGWMGGHEEKGREELYPIYLQDVCYGYLSQQEKDI